MCDDFEEGFSDVGRWLKACCDFAEGCGSQVWVLHNSYVSWALRADGLLLRRTVFEQMLRLAGARIEGAGAHQVVNRLVLRSAFLPGHPAPDGVEEMDEAALLEAGPVTATRWLRDFLLGGPRNAGDVHQAALAAHFSWGAIHSAKRRLGVVSEAGAWALPVVDDAPMTRREIAAFVAREDRGR